MKRVSRRDFLRMCAAGTCGAAIHNALSPVNGMLAFAAPPTTLAMGASPILIIVNLSGGCSYNSAPIYHGVYRDKNPTISYGPENSLAINSEQGMHPSLTGMRAIYNEGRLALLNLVGYPNPNRSHKESTDIWFQGARNSTTDFGGWGARLTCQLASTFGGISLAGQNLFIQGECYPPRALDNLQSFGERDFYWGDGSRSDWLQIIRDEAISKGTIPQLKGPTFVRDSMIGLQESVARIRQVTSNTTLPSGISFGNGGFASQCADAARLIMSNGLGTRLLFLEMGGFDTHTGERQAMNGLMNNLDDGLSGLVQVAKATGNWDRTIIITMSEFSRTMENNSGGNDHGHAGPMWVMGGAVSGGIKSPTPGPSQMGGDYFHDYDVHFIEPFYQAVQAMGLNADLIFPEAFSRKNFTLFT